MSRRCRGAVLPYVPKQLLSDCIATPIGVCVQPRLNLIDIRLRGSDIQTRYTFTLTCIRQEQVTYNYNLIYLQLIYCG